MIIKVLLYDTDDENDIQLFKNRILDESAELGIY